MYARPGLILCSRILIITEIDIIRDNITEIIGEPMEWADYERNV